jgi:hypothetical protein
MNTVGIRLLRDTLREELLAAEKKATADADPEEISYQWGKVAAYGLALQGLTDIIREES